MSKSRLLIGSCICQKPRILEEFLRSLRTLDLSAFDASFHFYDDNQEAESSEILRAAQLGGPVQISPGPERNINYLINETTHYWNDALVMRVAGMKNHIITDAVEGGYDYLFLIDSDLLIHPGLINHLAGHGKEIISEIFWTAWQPGAIPMPNAWMYDKYEMAHPALDANTINQLTAGFISRLRTPGVYEVGGLGACTLIAASALKKGVSFTPIKNVSFWGEDRWFCIRAAVLDIPLFVDTHFPARHLYRESELQEG